MLSTILSIVPLIFVICFEIVAAVYFYRIQKQVNESNKPEADFLSEAMRHSVYDESIVHKFQERKLDLAGLIDNTVKNKHSNLDVDGLCDSVIVKKMQLIEPVRSLPNIAMLIGLCGTIFTSILAFYKLSGVLSQSGSDLSVLYRGFSAVLDKVGEALACSCISIICSIGFSIYVQRLSTQMEQHCSEIQKFFSVYLSAYAKPLPQQENLEKMRQVFEGVSADLKTAVEGISTNLKTAVDDIAGSIGQISQAVSGMSDSSGALQTASRDMTDAFRQMQKQDEVLQDHHARHLDDLDGHRRQFLSEMTSIQDKLGEILSSNRGLSETFSKSYGDSIETINSNRETIVDSNRNLLDSLKEKFESYSIAVNSLDNDVAQLNTAIALFTETIKELTPEELSSLTREMASFNGQMQSSSENLKNASETLGDRIDQQRADISAHKGAISTHSTMISDHKVVSEAHMRSLSSSMQQIEALYKSVSDRHTNMAEQVNTVNSHLEKIANNTRASSMQTPQYPGPPRRDSGTSEPRTYPMPPEKDSAWNRIKNWFKRSR